MSARDTMRGWRARVAVATVAVLLLAGCAQRSLVVEGSEVTIALAQPFTSYNDQTVFGNNPENTAIVSASNSRFASYDDAAVLQPDDSFGSYDVVSEDPLTVRYTVNDGVLWSDGEPVDGADLLLAWVANSGRLNTPEFSPDRYRDAATGTFTEDFPDDVVYFDGALRAGLQHVTELPQLGADGRSITLVYDEYFVDWELSFQVGLPAHIVAEAALDLEAEEGKQAVIDAIQTADEDALAELSRSWNNDFSVDALAGAPERLVGSGPYTITGIDPGASVTLTANPRYTGRHLPSVETITVTTISDPNAAVAALDEGSVDIVVPAASADVLGALDRIEDAAVSVTDSATFEHLDLQFANSRSGHFSDPLIREAFLVMVPREAIIKEVVEPLNPDADTRDSFVFLPGTPGYPEAVEAGGASDYAKPDLRRARNLLVEAGVASPEVCILFDPNNPRRVAEFSLIQDSAARAGFVVTNCSRPDWVDFLGVSGVYDAALFGWNSSNLAVGAAEARLRSDSAISNLNSYSSETVDGLLDKLAVARDADTQRELLTAIDVELWADLYGLPLYQYPVVTAWNTKVTGVSSSPLAPGVFWNVWEWKSSADSESSSPSR